MPPRAPDGWGREHGNRAYPPVTETGYPWMTGEGCVRRGASVVVRGRESRPHGEGGQEVDRVFNDGGCLWTQTHRPTRSGYSAFRESFISGAGLTPKGSTASCGGGLPIAATCGAPGG